MLSVSRMVEREAAHYGPGQTLLCSASLESLSFAPDEVFS